MTSSRTKRRQEISPLSLEEADRLLAQPNPRYISGLRNRAMLEVMLRAGLRASEVCNLRAGDVRLVADAANGTGWLEVRHSKRDGSRNIPIGPRLAGWLAKWAARRPDSEWFFCTTSATALGRPITRNYLQEMAHHYAIKAGLEEDALRWQREHPGQRVRWRVHPHVFRHSFAVIALDHGTRLDQLMTLLGHASLATTQHYLHPRSRDLANLAAAYG